MDKSQEGITWEYVRSTSVPYKDANLVMNGKLPIPDEFLEPELPLSLPNKRRPKDSPEVR